jgi:hypothetical protein
VKRVLLVLLGGLALASAMTACSQKIPYKPYLPEQFRGNPEDPDPTIPGLFTGKRRGFVVYGR